MKIEATIDEEEVVAQAMLAVIEEADWIAAESNNAEDRKYYKKLRKSAVKIFKHFVTADRHGEVE